MNNMLIISLIISIIYFIFKFLEMRFIIKENKPLKELVKDSLFVYISSLIGFFILEQFNNMLESDIKVNTNPPAFTNEAPF